MRRIRLIIEYDGTNYVGWQVQPNGISVQQRLNEALKTVTGETIQVHGSGRTDSGVHARAQVAHFDTSARMRADKFAIAMNVNLPDDIRVLYSEECDPAFHSRFAAKEKSYRYTLLIGEHAHVFTRNTALHVHSRLDVDAMRRAAAHCVGEHDFRAFMSAGSTIENTVRTILRSEWTQDGSYLHYDVTGTGFLYNMVRILAGTMLDIGMHRLDETAVETALMTLARGDAGATAPAHGLMLMRVKYPDFDTEEILSHL